MKKFAAILIVSMMLISGVVAFAEPLSGGWAVAENTAITTENKSIFDKAMEGFTGVDYEPIAYLGSQVVAGMNHCFLCKATVVYPDAAATLALVYIYEDLNGNMKITQIANLEISALATKTEN